MVHYSRPVTLPAEPGDSVDIQPVICNFCKHETTVAVIRTGVLAGTLKVQAVVTICCDMIAKIYREAEEEMSK